MTEPFGLGRSAGGLGRHHTAVPPGTAVRSLSARPTSNQARTRMARPARSLGRMVRDGGEGRRLIDQGNLLADGPRPVCPGAPFRQDSLSEFSAPFLLFRTILQYHIPPVGERGGGRKCQLGDYNGPFLSYWLPPFWCPGPPLGRKRERRRRPFDGGGITERLRVQFDSDLTRGFLVSFFPASPFWCCPSPGLPCRRKIKTCTA